MRAFASDRLKIDENGRLLLSCRHPKEGWNARVPGTLTHSEHPGTAVLWEEQVFEVIEVTALPIGVRYGLEPWRDVHTIRVSERYDEESETHRAALRQDVAAREKGRWAANLLGFLTGHLPGNVQEQLANELGANAVAFTLLSLIPGIVGFGIVLKIKLNARMGDGVDSVPGWVSNLLFYFALDALVRGIVAISQKRAVGSFPGLLLYGVYYALAPNKEKLLSPFARRKGEGILITEPPPDVALRDRITVMEPFFTLLSAREQERLRKRYDYNYRGSARFMAIGIFFFSVMGVVSSISQLTSDPRFSAVFSLLTAIYLTAEQIYRVVHFSEGPVGSILGVLVRPFSRKYLFP